MAGCMHQDDGNIKGLCDLQRPVVEKQGRYVIDQGGACGHCSVHDRGLAGVDGDSGSRTGQTADQRFNAGNFVPFPHQRRAGACGFTADIDDGGTSAGHGERRIDGRFDIPIFPAVGKTVGRHIDDTHHLRLVQTDRPLPQLQGRARRCQAGVKLPATRLLFRRNAGEKFVPLPHIDKVPFRARARAVNDLDLREPQHRSGKPNRGPVMALRTFNKSRGTKVKVYHGSVARR